MNKKKIIDVITNMSVSFDLVGIGMFVAYGAWIESIFTAVMLITLIILYVGTKHNEKNLVLNKKIQYKFINPKMYDMSYLEKEVDKLQNEGYEFIPEDSNNGLMAFKKNRNNQ